MDLPRVLPTVAVISRAIPPMTINYLDKLIIKRVTVFYLVELTGLLDIYNSYKFVIYSSSSRVFLIKEKDQPEMNATLS